MIKKICNWIKSLFVKKPPKVYYEFIKPKPLPKLFTSKVPCKYCKEPMNRSIGQIVYFHKKCRTKGRNRNA